MVNRLGQYKARLKVIASEGAAKSDLGLILDFRERDLDARSEFAPLLVFPSPRSPASSEDGKKTQRTARVPIENCLTVGVQSNDRGAIGEQLRPKIVDLVRKPGLLPTVSCLFQTTGPETFQLAKPL